MQKQTTIREPNLRRFVHDFDELADVLHTLADHDDPRNRRSDNTSHEMEFTTEWQMAETAEEVYSG